MTDGQRSPVRRRQRPASSGGELALIRSIRAKAASVAPKRGSEVQLGIGDDCAILRPHPGEEIVVTTDFSLEGRHFRRDWHSPESAGHRTLARGLSDLAAMGARPVAAFLSLALPKALAQQTSWVNGFLRGLLRLAATVGVPLAGGDTAQAPETAVLADIVLLGAVPQRTALRRDGARAGDRIFVTGALGGAAMQLQALLAPGPKRTQTRRPGGPGTQPHFFPEPRLAAGQALRARGLATAAIDLSDGISTDLRHVCEASGLCAELDSANLPLHPLLRDSNPTDALQAAMHGGEDYELLFTAPATARVPRTLGGVRLTEIGRMVVPRRGRPLVTLVEPSGKRTALAAGGWEHLR